jgi:hypothetical protein
MMGRRTTVILAGLTLLVLVLSLPGRSLRAVFDRGGIYLFSRAFLELDDPALAGDPA